MEVFVIINNTGIKINVDVNAKNWLTKVYVIKNAKNWLTKAYVIKELWGIIVYVTATVINHVKLDNV